tara:strand:- start:526 stop:744 length:219 start_codon:yes stop_codon:yes gene_type:complete
MPGCPVTFVARVLLSAKIWATDKPLTVLLERDFPGFAEWAVAFTLPDVAALNRTLASGLQRLLRWANVVGIR